MATRYQDDWIAAPANRKDLFEGSANQHWPSGIKPAAADDPGFSTRQGQDLPVDDTSDGSARFGDKPYPRTTATWRPNTPCTASSSSGPQQLGTRPDRQRLPPRQPRVAVSIRLQPGPQPAPLHLPVVGQRQRRLPQRLDSDLNLHGGCEHGNLFEQNTVKTPYDHRSGSCTANCGGEGGEVDEGTWYPIWWAAGPKAIKWSGSSGPQNVFYNNSLTQADDSGRRVRSVRAPRFAARYRL
ncbi:hypothetical protein [Streptomyces parvulus]|uniref:hypothetical protein n=1 Tax=Streptomyces parvulus TaxID=146923 RepID=UPI003696F079